MNLEKAKTIALRCFAVAVVASAAWQARTQDAKAQDSAMAPVDQYLMADGNAEIAQARSPAPESISREAEVMILGQHGYETAVQGQNGFVCIVERSWMLPYDDPEFWDPKGAFAALRQSASRTISPATYFSSDSAGFVRDAQGADVRQNQGCVRQAGTAGSRAWFDVLHDVETAELRS